MTPPPDDQPGPPFPVEPIDPDLLAWARQTFNMVEFMEGVREIQATGGIPSEVVLAAVEAAMRDES